MTVLNTCYICLGQFAQTHEHHIFPQAYALDASNIDERTVPLCGTCHTALHSQQVALASKDPKKRDQRYFPPEQFERAKDLIDAIILAKQRWEAAGKPGAQTVQVKLDRPTVQMLHAKKGDFGYTNLADFVAAILSQWTSSNFR